MQGDVTLQGIAPIVDLSAGRCEGGLGARYASEGAQVTIVNEASVTVGTGTLGPGSWTPDGTCVFPYSAQVGIAQFYTARIGTSPTITFTRDQALTQRVGFRIG
ncbi:hypothetical protein ASG84_24835 [Rhodococcus sp. Leaf278]|nr:hypothetical protein ASG84_24835 [Rhodococcus sp. Leaf278]